MNKKNDSSMEYINFICSQMRLNRAAVLVGAGFSLNADKRSSASKAYPLWKELGESFARKISATNYT
jgi:hypothetical protein